MRSFEQYDEICKYFAEGSQKDNNANEVRNIYNYITIDENFLHGTGRRIENALEGITLQIEKKAESAGALNAYIYPIMDAQLNIQNGTYVSAVY